ncbi:MAG: hypothetical protein ABEK12_00555 [Candidatus Nanohaloarchaea archaeon]
MSGGAEAALVTYRARGDRFDSRSERNKFYRGLFGYRRTVRRNDTVYEYEKDGLMDDIPHIKVADAVFIVPRSHLDRVRDYLRDWTGKVEFRVFMIVLEDPPDW